MERHPQPTMTDVARRAGVSPMTVSRVVNGSAPVRESTRNKVGAAMAALSYTPNREARNLAGSKPVRVGFFHDGLFGIDLGEFLVGLLGQASLDNVQLFVERCDAAGHQAAQLRRMLLSGVDGLILGPLHGEGQVASLLAAAGVPAVMVDGGRADRRIGTVDIDVREAARRMTRHLIALGHERIGFVCGHGAGRDDGLVVLGGWTYRDGLKAAARLLGLPARPTAIVAGNDDLAAAVIAVAQASGFDVPGDLTVTGFGDTRLATTIWPELTTIRQPSAAMARSALQSLVRRIRALRKGELAEPEHLSLGYELVRRQSDAAPRRRPQAIFSI